MATRYDCMFPQLFFELRLEFFEFFLPLVARLFVMFVVSIQVEVCLRYKTDYRQDFFHEADMANILRHKNILALYGVVIASSYSPSLALVSFL